MPYCILCVPNVALQIFLKTSFSAIAAGTVPAMLQGSISNVLLCFYDIVNFLIYNYTFVLEASK